jgi:glutamate N-acetyltransferase/amino-acid N-acetyltransferase
VTIFLFAFDEGTTCAGVYTVSRTASADVLWCRQALEVGGGMARALVANSGNSNAFTGPKGQEKNEATLKAVTETLGVAKEHCFLAATGVIGEPLADPNYVGAFVPDLAASWAPGLGSGHAGLHDHRYVREGRRHCRWKSTVTP